MQFSCVLLATPATIVKPRDLLVSTGLESALGPRLHANLKYFAADVTVQTSVECDTGSNICPYGCWQSSSACSRGLWRAPLVLHWVLSFTCFIYDCGAWACAT